MRHDTHAWSWAICLSFTTALSWVIPFECLSGSTAVAAPVPIPIAAEEDGRDRPPPRPMQYIPKGLKSFAESNWYPVMDLLDVPRTYNFANIGELVLYEEWDSDDLPPHGAWIEGMWGLIPIMVNILASTDHTAMAHLEFNGLGGTPDEDTQIYLDEDVRVAETAMIVHNQLTGEQLGMKLELVWFEENDDDFDDITTFPISLPTRVIEDPGHDFFTDNPFYDDYFEWSDFALTDEGQQRSEDKWRQGCEEISPCATGPCPDDPQGWWWWCPFSAFLIECGEPNLDTFLGRAYFNYQNCLRGCEETFAYCMAPFGGAAGLCVYKLLKKAGKKLTQCVSRGIPIKVCLGVILVGSAIVGIGIWFCWNLRETCRRNCLKDWATALADDRDREIGKQCEAPAP